MCGSDVQPLELLLSSIRMAVIVNAEVGETPEFSKKDLIDLYKGKPVGS